LDEFSVDGADEDHLWEINFLRAITGALRRAVGSDALYALDLQICVRRRDIWIET
jgi:hypothetical protein